MAELKRLIVRTCSRLGALRVKAVVTMMMVVMMVMVVIKTGDDVVMSW